MDAETIERMATFSTTDQPELESVFHEHYGRVARVIARVVRDRGRAEDLAVEVFLRLWKRPLSADANVPAWLNRTAVRIGLDELRRRARRERCEKLVKIIRPANPEEVRAAVEEQERVRRVLARLDRGKAELLVLRSNGLSYQELAAALNPNPASVGKLLARAQASFRKEYVRRYGRE